MSRFSNREVEAYAEIHRQFRGPDGLTPAGLALALPLFGPPPSAERLSALLAAAGVRPGDPLGLDAFLAVLAAHEAPARAATREAREALAHFAAKAGGGGGLSRGQMMQVLMAGEGGLTGDEAAAAVEGMLDRFGAFFFIFWRRFFFFFFFF
jgi:hypothetical protein